MKLNNIWSGLTIGLVCSLLFHTLLGADKPAVSTTVAVVNGELIVKDELYAYMLQQYGEEAATKLISEKLIEQQTKKLGITISKQDIEAELHYTAEAYPSREAFYEALFRWKLTLEEFKEQLQIQVAIEKLLGEGIVIDDRQAESYYNEHLDLFNEPETVRASHILTRDMESANMMLQQLREGALFSELAERYSEDEQTRQSGGDVGLFPRGVMTSAFEDAAFQLDIGDISQVVRTERGYHIIQVTERNKPEHKPYEMIKEKVKHRMFKDEVSRQFPTWLEQLRKDADIELLFEKKMSMDDYEQAH